MENTSPASGTIRMLIIDDHPLVAAGLRYWEAEFPDCEVVGEVQDASEVEEAVRSLRPDLAVIDIRLGESGNGIDVARRLKEDFPGVKLLILSAYAAYPYVKALYQLGVHGYLLKTEPIEAVFEAARSIIRRDVVYGRDVMSRLIASVNGNDLTDREAQMLQLVAEGLTNEEIAERLSISMSGVSSRLQGVFNKLGARNRPEAIVRATRAGLIVIEGAPAEDPGALG